MTSSKKKPQKSSQTTAFHGSAADGVHHVVGVGNLRVVIVQDGEAWFAQGLEIDYAAQGDTIADARKQFTDGLCATTHEHLRIYGTIERLLKLAPTELWRELLLSTSAIPNRYSQLSVHAVVQETLPAEIRDVFPFDGINYLEMRRAGS